MKARRFFTLLLFSTTLLVSFTPKAPPQQDLRLWYTAPATAWTEAIPIGNGRLGGMIFGGPEKDRIQFNEETLWTGEPRDYNRADAASYLPQIRQLLQEGKQDEAEALAQVHFMGKKSNEEDYEQKKAAWIQKVKAIQTASNSPTQLKYDDSRWEEIAVPASQGWESVGMEGMDGAVWYRTTFDLPKQWRGKNLVLELGRTRDDDFTFVNGKLVGASAGKDISRRYVIPKNQLNRGKNVIAVQVLNYYDKGGLTGVRGNEKPISLYPEGDAKANPISLERPWKVMVQDNEPPAFPQYQASYQPFGDLWLNFAGHETATNYKRELDISQAVARTSYTVNGVTFTREYFASSPNQVIAVRLTASKPGQLNFETALTSPHKKSSTRKVDDKTLALSLQVINGALRGESFLRADAKGGQITVTKDNISVSKADEVTLYLTAGTNYVKYNNVSGDPAAVCRKALESVQNKAYDQVRTAHVQDYQQYFNTLSIDLGSSANQSLPTDERIAQFASSSDPAMVALYLQYGRYLLLASSRPGTRPPNIQGIWNDLMAPPWGSKYTTNINVEMIYWPAEVLNLSPLHGPLFDMIDELAERGEKTAKVHYNAPGWVTHHNTDLWRGTAPINNANHGIWVTGAAWLSHHLWEHYQFTQDKEFLRNRAYPVMKESARFFTDFLVEDPETGWLISTPSNSPENGGLVAGPTMDHQLIRSLFKKCIEASKVLNTDADFRAELQAMWPKIAPNQIGKHGQLQEWLQDVDDPENKHRHVSHLWGMHPGDDITWDKSPELMQAARQSLLFRGDEGTGWSLAWKINFWARFKEGDHAYKMIQMLIHPAASGGGSYPNLFDAHPPFQIDGNFGGAAGIAEMLLQSHEETIDLLPALPAALPEGEINGICARGGFVLNMKWANGKLQGLEVTSKAGKKCALRYGEKVVQFDTQEGKTYKLDQNLNLL